ncbi:hypothetical protein HYFRA_00005734 [Hymenoscyphus fraxineus]|uniref:Uncharacterized protein n=1 Tax=Hymenoscyphus fraxineus TaxID=746836 RepID=A0A9N9KQA4_9HELO|nr:hypothetical protein HYFRA_00005734 [Hymenoscyphus fraxineus]
MGNAFSGPDAFKFLGFTKEATAVLQANPSYLLILGAVLFGCKAIIGIAYYIHYVTNKPYYKPKPKKEDKKVAAK